MSAARGFGLLAAMTALEREDSGAHRLGVIAERAALGASQTNKLLALAEEAGLVRREGYGRYRLARAASPRTGGGPEKGREPGGPGVDLPTGVDRDLLLRVRAEAGGTAVALHVPHLLPSSQLLCNLVDLVCAPELTPSAVELLAHQPPVRTAAGRAMLALTQRAEHGGGPTAVQGGPGGHLPDSERAGIRSSGLARHHAGGWESLAAVLSVEGRLTGTLTILGPRPRNESAVAHWESVLRRAAARFRQPAPAVRTRAAPAARTPAPVRQPAVGRAVGGLRMRRGGVTAPASPTSG